MPCCQYHNRLDKKLHTNAYGGKLCGSPAIEIEQIAGNPGVWSPKPDDEGNIIQKPHFCCFECPTLKGQAAQP